MSLWPVAGGLYGAATVSVVVFPLVGGRKAANSVDLPQYSIEIYIVDS